MNDSSSKSPHSSEPLERSSLPRVFSASMPIDEHGRVGIGGTLSQELLIEAYREGIFPWYETAPIQWFSPHERMVLVPRDFYVARTLRRWVRREGMQLRHSGDRAFGRVMQACAEMRRSYGEGTWINKEMIAAYEKLHRSGLAHSVEVWAPKEAGDGEDRESGDNSRDISEQTISSMKLVGGLYGVWLGGMFFGESMFSRQTNVSKLALWLLCGFLRQRGTALIDCQVASDHLASLGAYTLPRATFVRVLKRLQRQPTQRGAWSESWREELGERVPVERLLSDLGR